MATYYVDPAATGGGTGLNWTDAWTAPSDALATVAPGDTVYLRGTYTPSGTYWNVTTAGAAGAFIKWIGVNSAGVDDGTPFVIDADSYGIGAITAYHYFKNIEIKNGSNSGVYQNAGYVIFHKVYIHDCARGFQSKYYCVYIQCSVRNNTQYGWYGLNADALLFCDAIGNGTYGMSASSVSSVIGCIVANNTSDGIQVKSTSQAPITILQNVIDGNGGSAITDDNATTQIVIAILNRLTNSVEYGIHFDNASSIGFENFNFFLNNTIAPILDDGDLILGGDSLSAGTEGYTDRANDNFNLTDFATMRSTPLQVGCVD
jgi:hypothetical protein